ncbi:MULTISPECIES: hypothetical protein [unclassified Streptomyces]|uniref:hypothetical protein n=1 Tax=unclassified Streptomyces TaxID=2593676 RepID=UPI003807F0F2
MISKHTTGPALVHLTMVWLMGSALTAVGFFVVGVGLFAGGATAGAVAALCWAPVAVALLAAPGFAARHLIPVTKRRGGVWAWAAAVFGAGTAGALIAVAVRLHADGLRNGFVLYVSGGVCYALAAAFFLPGARTRIAAVVAAALFATGGAWTAWDAGRPPTLGTWLRANDVDRALLRVGDAPPGYALSVRGASEDGFGADYERPGTTALHLAVERTGEDTRRVDARGCPVPFGETIRCTDDGGGRLLVTYESGYERRELRLHRGGLVCTVTLHETGPGPGLAAARRILSTLRPATDAELAPLTQLPMRD